MSEGTQNPNKGKLTLEEEILKYVGPFSRRISQLEKTTEYLQEENSFLKKGTTYTFFNKAGSKFVEKELAGLIKKFNSFSMKLTNGYNANLDSITKLKKDVEKSLNQNEGLAIRVYESIEAMDKQDIEIARLKTLIENTIESQDAKISEIQTAIQSVDNQGKKLSVDLLKMKSRIEENNIASDEKIQELHGKFIEKESYTEDIQTLESQINKHESSIGSLKDTMAKEIQEGVDNISKKMNAQQIVHQQLKERTQKIELELENSGQRYTDLDQDLKNLVDNSDNKLMEELNNFGKELEESLKQVKDSQKAQEEKIEEKMNKGSEDLNASMDMLRSEVSLMIVELKKENKTRDSKSQKMIEIFDLKLRRSEKEIEELANKTTNLAENASEVQELKSNLQSILEESENLRGQLDKINNNTNNSLNQKADIADVELKIAGLLEQFETGLEELKNGEITDANNLNKEFAKKLLKLEDDLKQAYEPDYPAHKIQEDIASISARMEKMDALYLQSKDQLKNENLLLLQKQQKEFNAMRNYFSDKMKSMVSAENFARSLNKVTSSINEVKATQKMLDKEFVDKAKKMFVQLNKELLKQREKIGQHDSLLKKSVEANVKRFTYLKNKVDTELNKVG